jgi:hypothetical protein
MCRSMIIVRRFLLIFSGCLVLSAAAQAQVSPETYNKPMPKIAALARADFDSRTDFHEQTPFNQEALAYSFRLPNGWRGAGNVVPANGALTPKILMDLARFYSPPSLEARSSFIVQGVRLEYPQTAQQWFIQYLVANGYTVEGMQVYSPKRAEALYVGVEGDESYIIRSVLEINGKYALMAQFKMPVELWDQHKQTQAQVIDSFRIKNPSDEPAENMKDYRFLDIAQVSYPLSWEMRAQPVRSVEAMGFDLFNTETPDEYSIKNRVLNGKISVRLIALADDGLKQKVHKLKDELVSAGVVLKEPIEEKENPVLDAAAKNPIFEVLRATYAKNPQLDYEVWLTAFERNGYVHAVMLETPSRDKDYFTWARNTETYKVIVGSLRPSAP